MLAHLIDLVGRPNSTAQTKALVALSLKNLGEWLEKNGAGQALPLAQRAHYQQGARRIADYFASPKDYVPLRIPEPPPGQPIGDTLGCDW